MATHLTKICSIALMYFLLIYAIMHIQEEGALAMRCVYDDGLKVNYSGPVQIVKGEEVDVLIKQESRRRRLR
jgi:hypothetical protein